MDSTAFGRWIGGAPLFWVGLVLLAAMFLAAWISSLFRRPALLRTPAGADVEKAEKDDGQEGYIVTAVLGLLALLMGFTFSLVVDRFDTRRHLVLEEANAIGTAYLRTQLLAEPHRSRLSGLFVHYVDNRLALAGAVPGGAPQRQLLETNDALLTDIWAATAAAFDGLKGAPFASAYLGSINAVIDLDESRKTARAQRVPVEVFAILFIYLVTTAGVLGYVLRGHYGRLAAGFLLVLLTLSMVLIIDINRPTTGGITESQQPMEDLRKSMATPPTVYDKWRTPEAR